MENSTRTVLIPCDELYNEFEFWYPYYRLKEAGYAVVVAGPAAGAVVKSKVGLPAVCDVAYDDIRAEDFVGVVIPGGFAPDKMRRNRNLLNVIAELDGKGLLVAHICHAGWVPVSAGILKGRTTTSFFAIRDDLVNAGATWVDEEVVVDGNLVSSRTPEDLPAFMRGVLTVLDSL